MSELIVAGFDDAHCPGRMTDTLLWDLEEAARQLGGLSPRTVRRMIERGELPIKKGLLVDDDDLVRAAVIQDLMCYDRLDFDKFGADHGINFREYFADEVEQLDVLEKDGLIELSDEGIQITPSGRLLLRNIAMTFDRYMGTGENDNRFSRAI